MEIFFDKIEMRKIEYGTEEYEETIDIRNEYFRKPQGENIRNEDLSGDKDKDMYAGFIDGKMMSTVFLAHVDDTTGQVNAVIVDKKYQDKHIGNFLMQFIEQKALEKGYKKLILTGRVKVEGFYEKCGFVRAGEVFDYHTVPHVLMEKNIAEN